MRVTCLWQGLPTILGTCLAMVIYFTIFADTRTTSSFLSLYITGGMIDSQRILYVIGTRFFRDTDPRSLSVGGRNAYRSRCEMLLRITVPSVTQSIQTLKAGRQFDDLDFVWRFDSEYMMHEPTCAEALMLANITLEGQVRIGSIRQNTDYESARNGLLIMSRIDSDDAVHSTALTHIFDSVITNVRDTGFWYVSMPNAVFWLNSVGGRCGSFATCPCLHKALMQTHAVYGPMFPACRNSRDYTTCVFDQKLGLYSYPHNKINEHTPTYISPHFPKCADLDRCRTYLCRGGEPIPIRKDGSMNVSPRKWCPKSDVPLTIYTQTGIQDSQQKHIDPYTEGESAGTKFELEGEAVCDVLQQFNIELPIIDVVEPIYQECVLFSSNRTRCEKGYESLIHV